MRRSKTVPSGKPLEPPGTFQAGLVETTVPGETVWDSGIQQKIWIHQQEIFFGRVGSNDWKKCMGFNYSRIYNMFNGKYIFIQSPFQKTIGASLKPTAKDLGE